MQSHSFHKSPQAVFSILPTHILHCYINENKTSCFSDFFFNTSKIRKYGVISSALSPNVTSDKVLNTLGIHLAVLNWLTIMICICTTTASAPSSPQLFIFSCIGVRGSWQAYRCLLTHFSKSLKFKSQFLHCARIFKLIRQKTMSMFLSLGCKDTS